MKKKIAVLYSGAYVWGGVETYLKNLISDSSGLGFYFFSMGKWDLTDALKDKIEVEVLSGARINILLPLQIGKKLKEKKISVLVSQGVVANFYARLTCLFFRKKHICVVHSDLVSEYQIPIIRFLYYLTDRGLRRVTGLFICVSEYLKKILLERGVPERKIRVIYSGIDFGGNPANDQRPTTNSKFIIGSLGRLKKEKGYDILIESAKDLDDDIEIRICGEGSERENLEKIIRENNLEDKVKLLGHTNDIDKFLGEIDLYIQPSRSEGFGFSVVEAMAKGVPVIVSGRGALEEVVGEKGTILNKINPAKLAKAISEAKDNYNGLKEKAEKNREDIVKKFGKRRWRDETVKAILEFDKS